jgi:hypothetical protein
MTIKFQRKVLKKRNGPMINPVNIDCTGFLPVWIDAVMYSMQYVMQKKQQ